MTTFVYTAECPEEKNNCHYEQYIQVIMFHLILFKIILQKMNEKNADIFDSFKNYSRKGFYSPIIIENNDIYGFYAKSYEKIKALTLISEYAGEVILNLII